MNNISTKKNLDKFRGCLIGGAAGDALGYAVEFDSESYIRSKFGADGITRYRLHKGLARISDDTQMTLFTANGLLYGSTKACLQGLQGCYPMDVATAYREWYQTQTSPYAKCNREVATCWLLNVPELFARRAPGYTCMSAIEAGCCGTPERPLNDSKGCGGVMRVAPVGLYCSETPALAAQIGADIAALTHGHEMGYIPAAMLVHILCLVIGSEQITLKTAVQDSLDAMQQLFPEAVHMPAFLCLMNKAVELAERDVTDLEAIHALGEGWCGDEALAVAVYCALKHSNDFDKALIAAVNHGGDSDSTGAITGNILGAYLGLSAIPEKYIGNLELLDVITELADDLHDGFPSADPEYWNQKYINIAYAGKKED